MIENSQNLQVISLILGLSCLFLIGLLFWKVRDLNGLRRVFFRGREGQDLEGVLTGLVQKLHLLEDEKSVLEARLAALQAGSQFAIQRIGVHRFNPFADGGGNFSFTLALLDGHGTGVVITSMHGREQNRIYAKQITKGRAETQLTEEEEQAIATAQNQTNP